MTNDALVLAEASAPSAVVSRAEQADLMDEAAFQSFYQRTARPLWAYVYRVTGHASDADDILQEAFCRLLRSPLVPPGEAERRAYVFTTASRLIIDRWRRAGRERRTLERLPVVEVHESADASLRQDLARTFRGMKPRDRALLWLAYVEGTEHREIAQALGLKERSVRVLLFRARRKLAGLLASKGLGPRMT